MHLRIFLIAFILWSVSFITKSGEPIVVGETLTIDSVIFKDKVTINITLPSSYGALTNKRYPVYYKLGDDEGYAVTAGTIRNLSHNREYPMPETILVSLTTDTAVRVIDRGVKSKDFIDLLETDVIPYIDKHYRTQPFRILSSGARFGEAPLYAFVHTNELFQAYITISPWISNKSGLLSEIEAFLKKNKDNSNFLWLSTGEGQRHAENYANLVSILQENAPETLDWRSVENNQNQNISQDLFSFARALEALFSDLYLDADSPIVNKGVDSVISYYKQLSANKYGYAVSGERVLNGFIRRWIKKKNTN